MKHFGFTLAEVLITLTIIGVVASITLPALQINVNKTTYEKQIMKFYSQLQESVKRYMADEGIDDIVFDDFSANTFVNKYFTIDKRCTTLSECVPNEYYNISNTKVDDRKVFSRNASVAYVLSDGTVFSINNKGSVVVDLNGLNKPNKVGYDLWSMQISNKGKVYGKNDSTAKATLLNLCKGGNEFDCFSYFKNNGYKIDY